MIKKISLLIVCCYLFTQCQKETGFGENGSIVGTVYLKDSLSNNQHVVANASVYVGFGISPDASNYNYKVTTDAQGKFIVPYLVIGKHYNLKITYEGAVAGEKRTYEKILINVFVSKTPPHIKYVDVILNQTDHVNTIAGMVQIKDSLSLAIPFTYIPVAGADVFLGYQFSPTPSNYTYKLITDADGYFKSPTLDSASIADYRFYVKKQVAVGGNIIPFVYAGNYSAFQSAGHQVTVAPSDSMGYVTIKLTAGSTPQPNATICYFSNRTFFDSSEVCEGSFHSSTTNLKGLSFISGLAPAAKYYYKAYLLQAQDTIWAKDSVMVSGTPYQLKTSAFQ